MHFAKQNNSPADQASIYDSRTLTTFAAQKRLAVRDETAEGSSEQLVVATGALEKGDAAI